MENNKVEYKWTKLLAAKRFHTEDGVVSLSPEEQVELIEDISELREFDLEMYQQMLNKENNDSVIGFTSALKPKYSEIRIGQIYDMGTSSMQPRQRIIVSQSEVDILRRFANVRKDEDLNETYIINDCEFEILPLITLNHE